MPTYERTFAFIRDFEGLTKQQQDRFLVALLAFIADLVAMEAGEIDRFRPGLRVKGVQGRQGQFEMTWAPDGRAIFMWGDPQLEGRRHVIWIRCGDHSILG